MAEAVNGEPEAVGGGAASTGRARQRRKKIRNTAGGVRMVKIMAVYDEDALYARRLAEYVNRRETIPFTAMAFSKLERLKEYGDSMKLKFF